MSEGRLCIRTVAERAFFSSRAECWLASAKTRSLPGTATLCECLDAAATCARSWGAVKLLVRAAKRDVQPP